MSEHNRSGFQSPLHIRISREFRNPSAQVLPEEEGSPGLGVCSEVPWGSQQQKDRRATEGKVKRREASDSQWPDAEDSNSACHQEETDTNSLCCREWGMCVSVQG